MGYSQLCVFVQCMQFTYLFFCLKLRIVHTKLYKYLWKTILSKEPVPARTADTAVWLWRHFWLSLQASLFPLFLELVAITRLLSILPCFWPTLAVTVQPQAHEREWRQKAPRAASLNNWRAQSGSTQNRKEGNNGFLSLFSCSCQPATPHIQVLALTLISVSWSAALCSCSVIGSPEGSLAVCWRPVDGRLINVAERLSWWMFNGTNCAFLMNPWHACLSVDTS